MVAGMVTRASAKAAGHGGSETGGTGHRQIKRGDIIWAAASAADGHAQKGLRPVLIIQNDVGNQYGSTVIVAMITSRLSSRQYPVNVAVPDRLLPKASEIKLHQIRTLDKSQLGKKMAHLPEATMNEVDEALRASLGLPRFD